MFEKTNKITSLKLTDLKICEIILALSMRIIKMWFFSPEEFSDKNLGMMAATCLFSACAHGMFSGLDFKSSTT